MANVAHTATPFEKTILVSVDEFAQFSKYQDLLKSTTPFGTAIAETGKSTKCLISSSSKWVNNSSATDHMTSNPSLFSVQSHTNNTTTPYVTLTDGSTSHILGFGIVKPTSLLLLTSLLSLPNFSFNPISVSKLT